MAAIFFFSLPAHGHVNPTLPLVRELTSRGHRVLYYDVEAFREKIEAAGAQFVPIDAYMPPAPEDIDRRAGKDFASLIEMAADLTLSLNERVAQDVAEHHPACVVGDSVCIWGKLLARRHGLPFICSTTTFAFNDQSARLMKRQPGEVLRMLLGMPRMARKLRQLREHGHDAPDVISLIGNDTKTPTIVYTSRLFQPMSETFGDSYAFVGPSVMQRYPRRPHDRPLVYVSLGTVLNNAPDFYRSALQALSGMDCDAILSIGDAVDPAALGPVPGNVCIYPRVNQLEVLAGADVFLTHCGMNSVSESLLCGVPMVLFPQHGEENAVAIRCEQLGAGLRLKRPSASCIRSALEAVLGDDRYRRAAQTVAEDFARCGGAAEAADFVEAHF
ncbi:MAG: macrolide family glycosyltransferase [Candidatus Ventricola sp.]|nr:macrolide family glycosyltransferase [Candidatus Ventricola sp.]MDY4855404.1 macrolide family glycosyltransferase [Candidatus Ventricola sp.]